MLSTRCCCCGPHIGTQPRLFSILASFDDFFKKQLLTSVESSVHDNVPLSYYPSPLFLSIIFRIQEKAAEYRVHHKRVSSEYSILARLGSSARRGSALGGCRGMPSWPPYVVSSPEIASSTFQSITVLSPLPIDTMWASFAVNRTHEIPPTWPETILYPACVRNQVR